MKIFLYVLSKFVAGKSRVTGRNFVMECLFNQKIDFSSSHTSLINGYRTIFWPNNITYMLTIKTQASKFTVFYDIFFHEFVISVNYYNGI